jgi:hypothetical protein
VLDAALSKVVESGLGVPFRLSWSGAFSLSLLSRDTFLSATTGVFPFSCGEESCDWDCGCGEDADAEAGATSSVAGSIHQIVGETSLCPVLRRELVVVEGDVSVSVSFSGQGGIRLSAEQSIEPRGWQGMCMTMHVVRCMYVSCGSERWVRSMRGETIIEGGGGNRGSGRGFSWGR